MLKYKGLYGVTVNIDLTSSGPNLIKVKAISLTLIMNFITFLFSAGSLKTKCDYLGWMMVQVV